MHAILRTIADESVFLSSYHMMKSLLLNATQGVSRDKRKGLARRCATPARGFSESSGDETNPSGNTTDGYTSGAINSDEDPYNLGSISGTETANEADPLFTVGRSVGTLELWTNLGAIPPHPEVDTAPLTISHCPSSDTEVDLPTTRPVPHVIAGSS